MVFRQSVGSLVRVLAIVGIALDALPVSCHAQMTAGDQTPGAASLSALSDRISDQISNETLGCEEVLPAAQLMHILRNSPEVMVEVKSLVADSAQQTWLSIQADALTDQQVYAQIEGSRELRASIMQFLRARGYVSEEEINTSIDSRAEDSRVCVSSKGGPEDTNLLDEMSSLLSKTGTDKIHNGSGHSGSRYEHDVLSTRPHLGDTTAVLKKIFDASRTLRNLLGTVQVAASIAIAATVMGL